MTDLSLSVALKDLGWHPAAWRDPSARPSALFTAGYWTDLAIEAERGLLDLITIEDSLGVQEPAPTHVNGRLDAVLVAAMLAPATTRIGLVPTTITTHIEPFHASIGIASLDYASRGRAGWLPRTTEAALTEADDFVEVVRRLWDSWGDDAEIRDVPTGRFLDREKLHYIDFEGAHFSVRGPSITPRPPQGQPLVAALAHDVRPYEFAARGADVVFITPRSRPDAVTIIAQVREAERTVRRTGDPLRIFADLLVFLDETPGAATSRKTRLDVLNGAPPTSDAQVFAGTPTELADLLLDWRDAGLDGFRLRPGVLPSDLTEITQNLVPQLQKRDAFRTNYETTTLRAHLGLARPANRYATSTARRRP
ncbi:LLM class flavin-dependent oxidoreductase [Actinomadura meridiana]|uniref:LLM class flavin-dependent oxidoreductase n=1 Tax=Actinomadura meridiana TaxID=559626 RepID=A0ABP8BW61_9ACTN